MIEILKKRAEAHYNRYKEYLSIGKLRAEGRLNLKGNIVHTQNQGINNFHIRTAVYDKQRPHFKGQCQAINTGDVFNVAAWINKEGNIRFEIYETDGYMPF